MSGNQKTPRTLPSSQWTSFDGWDYNGMKERLETLLSKLKKPILIRHAELITGQKVTMSEPFSAGQYWMCFELVADNGTLIIARVRLPRHPDMPSTVTEEDELYSIECEVATMQFVRHRLLNVPLPRVYAYASPGSKAAVEVGAAYMFLEGFYGNTLQDVGLDICSLPMAQQEHIMTQWTTVQAELATINYSQIGSICTVSENGEPIIGKLSTAPLEGLTNPGPFSSTSEYFTAIGAAALQKLDQRTEHSAGESATFRQIGALVFMDIVQQTELFKSNPGQLFPFNHMDLGTQNILVDANFTFLAVIDWEFAQTAPWQVNHYPMPFPLSWPEDKLKIVLKNPSHIAHGNVFRQEAARNMYRGKFREAEAKLQFNGRALGGSFARELDGKASRIYANFTRLGGTPRQDAELVREMARLGFGFKGTEMEEYLEELKRRPTSITAMSSPMDAFPDDPLVQSVKAYVKEYMKAYDASHDWSHIERVVSMAHYIYNNSADELKSKLDLRIIHLAALLHDVGDRKLDDDRRILKQ
ncbi:hypothetical protein N0V88_000960 [Collariella sp. IMI 366227]|nr:hypothetical protein N0V88_000960 [Collariella sp. IMI 366227]